MHEPTLDDVARRAGVHASTASRSLDPLQCARIGQATRERVRAAARELNYRPHLAASSLRRGRSHAVGVLLPDLSNPIYATLLRGVSERLEDDGYTAVIVETRDQDPRLGQALQILEGRRVDAVINAAARGHDSRELRRFARTGTPMVLAARDLPGVNLPKVLTDDLRGGALAAEHLLRLGHRRLAQLRGPDDVTAFEERERGFRTRVLDAGLSPQTASLRVRTADVGEGERAMRSLLRRREPPTGVFAHNDLLAIGAIAALRSAGLRCPDDVSVIGYNDTPLTEYLAPALSTVSLPAVEMGRIAAETVLGLLRGSPVGSAVALQPQLVRRASTGPPPTS